MPRTFVTFLVAFTIGAAAGAGVVWKIEQRKVGETLAMKARLAKFDEENRRLHGAAATTEKSRTDDINKLEREAVEQGVSAIRGLEFKEPVDYQTVSRKEIRGLLSRKLGEVISEQEFANISAAFAVLGLVEPDYPLREKYIDLLGEQIAAFYDHHAHKLFMYEDARLDAVQNRIVLAHELTHALQDQHFGLGKLALELKHDDDRSLAASALVEGEATLVMSDFTMRNVSRQKIADGVLSSLGQDTKQIANAPRYLREMLVFPYLRGQEFCAALQERGGYDALSEAYAHPPSSSAQILHPAKYFAESREEPVAIKWPDTAAGGKPPIADNVLGEIGVRIHLAEWTDDQTGETVATGWRGDRYLCYDGGRGLVWKTVWAGESEALAFFEAEKQVIERRHRPTGVSGDEHEYSASAPRFIRLKFSPPDAVVLIDAGTATWAKALTDQFLN